MEIQTIELPEPPVQRSAIMIHTDNRSIEMRWLFFLFVLCGCGSSVCALANEDEAKAEQKTILLVSEMKENDEQVLASGLVFLQKLYEVEDENEVNRIAQTELAMALADEYDMVVLYAIGKLNKQERAALKHHQFDGGSVLWFLQKNADPKFYRSLAGEMDRPLMPVLIDEYVEVAEDKAARVNDCSLLTKDFTRDLFFRGYWKIEAEKTQKDSISAVILSGDNPGVIYNIESRTAVVLVGTQRELSNWVEKPSWVVLLLQLHAILDSEPTTDKNASGTDEDCSAAIPTKAGQHHFRE